MSAVASPIIASSILGGSPRAPALFHHPAMAVPGAARQLKVTQRAASQNIGKHVRAGILAEATGRARNRIFVADGIIRAIEKDLPAEKD